MLHVPIAALDDVVLGVMRGARGASGFARRHPMLGAFKGTLPFFLPFAAAEMATAPRGEAVEKTAGFAGGFAASTATYGLVDHLLKKRMLGDFGRRRSIATLIGKRTLGSRGAMIAKAGFGLPAMAVATAASIVIDTYVQPRVEQAYKAVLHESKMLRHFNAGGDYEDTQVAFTMRQRAAQEMSTSLLNARAWLGKEALLFHE